MSSPTPARIGILGGQGPMASNEFHRRLLKSWIDASSTPLHTDFDYPDILHLSAALPGLDMRGLRNREQAALALAERIRLMRGWGANLVAAPCNSLHAVLAHLGASAQVPLLSPWGAAQPYLQAQSGPWLLLASPSLRKEVAESGRPDIHLPPAAVSALTDQAIELVACGNLDAAYSLLSTKLLDAMPLCGKDSVQLLIACTELSLVPRAFESLRPRLVLDTMDALVRTVVCTLAHPVVNAIDIQ